MSLTRLLLERFGLDVQLSPLPGEIDRNFALGDHVLKVHAGGTDAELLDLQDAAMEHVAARSLAVATPRLVRTRDGASRAPIDGGVARLLTWVAGTPWGRLDDHDAAALASLGRAVAELDAALADFEHPRLDRRLRWNMVQAGELVGAADDADPVLERFAEHVLPALRELPAQAIHNDANEHNVLVGDDGLVSGLIDFGDLCRAPRACGLAVACAYAMTALAVPERAVLPVVAGYHEVAPLTPAELALLPDLIRVRLATSVAMAALQRAEQPDNAVPADQPARGHGAAPPPRPGPRGAGAAPPARDLRLRAGPDRARGAALPRRRRARPCVRAGPRRRPVIDFSGADPPPPATQPAIGRYLEQRQVYASDAFEAELPGERRTLHLGVDVFLPAGEPILAPLDGVVSDVAYRPAADDFGGVVVLDHETPDGIRFHTLYGHLSAASAERLAPGQAIRRGDVVGELGDESENGGWAPHLHLQLLTTDLGRGTGADGVATLAERDVWESTSPDPNLLLGLPGGVRADPPRAPAELHSARRVSFSRALSLSYAEPLKIVRGEGAHLYDEDGRAYLDLVNNVCHVGHAHPRVVAAAAEQMARLNTNTRYLHDLIVELRAPAHRDAPRSADVVFLVNSGSEANDLALRLARARPAATTCSSLDHAYHGNLSSLVEICPYKFNGPAAAGAPRAPCASRGVPRRAEDAEDVRRGVARTPRRLLRRVAAGLRRPDRLPAGYLRAAFAAVRAAGARLRRRRGPGRLRPRRRARSGASSSHGVVPDIVTLGKPIGNGHPLGAVVTTPEIARAFVTGMEYFNTFGGNPVSARDRRSRCST